MVMVLSVHINQPLSIHFPIFVIYVRSTSPRCICKLREHAHHGEPEKWEDTARWGGEGGGTLKKTKAWTLRKFCRKRQLLQQNTFSTVQAFSAALKPLKPTVGLLWTIVLTQTPNFYTHSVIFFKRRSRDRRWTQRAFYCCRLCGASSRHSLNALPGLSEPLKAFCRLVTCRSERKGGQTIQWVTQTEPSRRNYL